MLNKTRSPRTLFGTDGVRGVANVEPMTPETVLRIGRGIVAACAKRPHGHRPKIVIGKDTRLSGYMIETALASGICSMGGDVLLCGPVPTPAVGYLVTSMRADAGVVISASHNPYEDNGIKIFGADGWKLPDALEAEIERLVLGPDGDGHGRPSAGGIGKAHRIDDALGRYVSFLKSTFPKDLTLEGLRVVVDCAHGAAYHAAPAALVELGAEVHAIGVEPNGKNINDGVGALYPQAAAKEVLRTEADVGLALDGDADRLIVLDDAGQVVDGDALMALVALRMLRAGTLHKRTLVATVMSNLGLDRAVERARGRVVRTPVGDRYVVETMRSGGYNLGGEQSGHLVFLDHATTGDGTLAALQLLAIVQREQKSVRSLVHGLIERVPQVLVNVALSGRPTSGDLASVPAVACAIRDVERALGKKGRVLVRMSGTENKARVLVEGPRETSIRAHAERIAETIRKALSSTSRPTARA